MDSGLPFNLHRECRGGVGGGMGGRQEGGVLALVAGGGGGRRTWTYHPVFVCGC